MTAKLPYNPSRDWFNAHKKELEERYLDKYVLVVNCEIVGSEIDAERLLQLNANLLENRDNVQSLFLGYVGIEPPGCIGGVAFM